MQALGRVSNQAIVESAQEGGQQAIQNLIAREVYKPEQQIGEGIVENMGVGGLVGGIAGLGREGVVAIGRRRSRSSRGERSRAVQDVPPPSPADEASPIPTADIVEGRERVADAEAAGRANEYLKVAGLPQVGQPVRVSRGRDVVEGVVTDAWDSDGEPGFTIESPDGTLTEGTLSTFANMGAEITGLPMPAPRAEIEKAAQDFAKEIDKLEQGAAKAMASEGQGPGPAPRLTRAQVVEVERLTRAGVPPGDAVVQVFSRAGAPPGDPYTPVTPTAEGFGGRPAPTVRGVAGTAPPPAERQPPGGPALDLSPGGVPEGGPALDLSPEGVPPGGAPFTREPGGVPPGGAPLDLSPEGVPPGGPAFTREPGGVPPGGPPLDLSPGGVPAGGLAQDLSPGGVPGGDLPAMQRGPETRPGVIGPSGRREDTGPDSRPVVVGPGWQATHRRTRQPSHRDRS